MKYLLSLMLLSLVACGESDREFPVLGEYWDGVGVFNNEEILFIYVSPYPADESIHVSYTTSGNTYSCRYYKVIGNSYISMPEESSNAVTKINILGDRFGAVSSGESLDPCHTVQITTEFIKQDVL